MKKFKDFLEKVLEVKQCELLTIYDILWSLINELGVILFYVVIPLLTGNL